jgi:uncharacterized iron-regulated membrane protein
MKNWRKVHIYSFGYLKVVSIIVCVHMVFISITGFLLNHRHAFGWMETARVTTSILPERYQERLDRVREAQGIAELFPEDARSVPVMWLIYDFHTGDILGGWGRYFYDAIGGVFIILAITGIYMYFRIRRKTRF